MAFRTDRQRRFFFANLGKLSSGQKRKIGVGLGLATLGLGLFLGRKTRGVRAVTSGIRRGAGRVAKQKNVRRVIRRGTVATQRAYRSGAVQSVKSSVGRNVIRIRNKISDNVRFRGKPIISRKGARNVDEFLEQGGTIKTTRRKGGIKKGGTFNNVVSYAKKKITQAKEKVFKKKGITIKTKDAAMRKYKEKLAQLKDTGGGKNYGARAWKKVIDEDALIKDPKKRLIPNEATLKELTKNKQVLNYYKKKMGPIKVSETLKKNTAIKELDELAAGSKDRKLYARPIALSKTGRKIKTRLSGEQEMLTAVAQAARKGQIPKSAVGDATSRLKTIGTPVSKVVEPKPLRIIRAEEAITAREANKYLTIDPAKIPLKGYKDIRKTIRTIQNKHMKDIVSETTRQIKNKQVNRTSGRLNTVVSRKIKSINASNATPEAKTAQIKAILEKRDSIIQTIKNKPLTVSQTKKLETSLKPIRREKLGVAVEEIRIRRIEQHQRDVRKVENDLIGIPDLQVNRQFPGQRSQAVNALTRSAEQKVAARAQKAFESQITSGSTHTTKRLGMKVKPDGTIEYIRLSEQSIPGISPASRSTRNIQVVTAKQAGRKRNTELQAKLSQQAEKEAQQRIKAVKKNQKKIYKLDSAKAIDTLEERTRKLLKDLDKAK